MVLTALMLCKSSQIHNELSASETVGIDTLPGVPWPCGIVPKLLKLQCCSMLFHFESVLGTCCFRFPRSCGLLASLMPMCSYTGACL